MIVSKEPLTRFAGNDALSLPCVPIPPVPGVQIGMRAVRCQGRRAREKQRAPLSLLWGREALRDETKTPAWETSSFAVGDVT